MRFVFCCVLFQQSLNLILFDRLLEKLGETDRFCFSLDAFKLEGRNGDQGHSISHIAELTGDHKTVQFGDMDIEEDQIVRIRLNKGQCGPAVGQELQRQPSRLMDNSRRR